MIDKKNRTQLFQLVATHAKELMREPAVLFWGIIFPILMALGLGIAFTKKGDITRNIAFISGQNVAETAEDTSRIKRLLDNQTNSAFSRKLGKKNYKVEVENDKLGKTIFIFIPVDWDKAIVLLKRGNINIIVEENSGEFLYHFDPLNPEAHLTYLQLAKLMKSEQPISTKNQNNIEPLTLTGTRYIDFLIPGLIAMGIMMSCLWGISYGLIEKRTKKLLRRMIATPMKKSHFLIALVTVRFGMNLIESALLFLFAFYFFSISIQGNILALIGIFFAGNIAFSGIAIFVSSRTANTEIGNGLINAIVLPMMVLSGIFFSYHNFPGWSLSFIEKLPLTILADSIRSVFIEGAGFTQVALDTTILTLIGVLFFTAGLKIFKWY
jgi:ABC-type multidrug transport system permease subunit